MVYELARKLYQILSNPSESRLGLCSDNLCFNVVNSDLNLNGNSHQHNQRRFYPFSRCIDTRRVSRKKKPSNNHSKVIEQRYERKHEISKSIQRLHLTKKLEF